MDEAPFLGELILDTLGLAFLEFQLESGIFRFILGQAKKKRCKDENASEYHKGLAHPN